MYRVVIGPGRLKEIGAAQGWAFAPDDQVGDRESRLPTQELARFTRADSIASAMI